MRSDDMELIYVLFFQTGFMIVDNAVLSLMPVWITLTFV